MDNQPTQSTPPPPSSANSSKTFLLILGTIALMTISAVGGYYLGARKSSTKPQNLACTQDALLCPDGSSVGRIPPSCQFAPCPTPLVQGLDAEIKYSIPPAWKTQQDSISSITLSSPDYIPGTIADTEQGVKINISKYSSETFSNSCAFVDAAGVSDPFDTTINGMPAILQTITYEGYQTRYCLIRNGFVWDIRFFTKQSEVNKYQNVIQQFLSSVHFTDKIGPTHPM